MIGQSLKIGKFMTSQMAYDQWQSIISTPVEYVIFLENCRLHIVVEVVIYHFPFAYPTTSNSVLSNIVYLGINCKVFFILLIPQFLHCETPQNSFDM